MANSATRVEFRVGYTARGQKLTLIGERDGAGQISWSIRQDRAGPADDGLLLAGISSAVIQTMANAVRESAS